MKRGAPESKPGHGQTPRSAAIRILVVEDNAADLQLIRRALQDAKLGSFKVSVGGRLSEALDLLARAPFDVVLADLGLPDSPRAQTVSTIRSAAPGVPLVVLTGLDDEVLGLAAVQEGAQDYLHKGHLDGQSLARTIRYAIERHRFEARIREVSEELEQRIESRTRALQEREAGLRRAQAMARLAHVITGPRGEFESSSESLPRLIGVEPAHVPASTREWLELVHPEDRADFRATAIEAARTGKRFECEYRLRRADGAWMHIKQVSEPLVGTPEVSGELRWFGTLQDVTEQKQIAQDLRESESLKSAIIEASLDCVVIIDHEGRIVEFNPAAEAAFGIKRGQALGKSMVDLIIPLRLRDAHRRGFAHYFATGEAPILGKRLEMDAIRADGTEFPIELAVTATRSGSRSLFTGFIRDLTERKRADERIRRLNRVYAVLSGINALIVRVRSREELFREACRIAVDAGQFRLAWIGVVDREGMQVTPAAWSGDGDGYIQAMPMVLAKPGAAGRGLAAQSIEERRGIIVDDMAQDPRVLLRKEAQARGFRSLAVLPLVVSGEAAGVLALYAGEFGFFDEEEMKLLMELAGDIAFAMQHLETLGKVEYLAFNDPLTGLPNRAVLTDRLGQILSAARRHKQLASVMLLDIERFRLMSRP